ncbi:MAG TPA: ATP-binding protein, partial [Opitutaceae bacterium]|nr:ATP-binding protein [Opitutaceae bacterium]
PSGMLRTRLYLGLLPLVLLVIAMGGYAIYVCRDLAGSLSRDLVSNYRAIVACEHMRESARQMYAAIEVAEPHDADRQAFETARSAFLRELMTQSASSAGTPREAFVEALDHAFTRFGTLGERTLRGQMGSSLLVTTQAGATALGSVLDAIENLTQRDFAAARQTAARVERLANATEQLMITTMAAGFLLSLFLAWRLAASLLKPIKAFTASVVAVGEGDLDREVPEYSRDELGQLARAFNTMSAKLRAYRDATLARVLRAQRTMDATLTSTPDPVFVVARDGTHEVRNPAAEQLAATSDFAAGFPPALAEPLARVLATGEHYLPADYSRLVTVRVEREDRHFLPRILAIGDKLTEFKGAAVILQDVTKFRLLDDAKTNLVGTVSHELKTPLTSLRMALYLLVEQKIGGLSSQQKELLEGARDDADRLLRILDNLLDLARLESGASALDRAPVPVSDLIMRIVGEARLFVEASEQRLVVGIAPDVAEATVNIDEGRIRHVFMNLLTNASKYSPRGSEIRLTARAADERGFVRFGVEDKGPGISADDVGRVFDRFFRASQHTKPGAGLGLAIARELVVAHGGSIACNSNPGEGSEFYFVLPR